MVSLYDAGQVPWKGNNIALTYNSVGLNLAELFMITVSCKQRINNDLAHYSFQNVCLKTSVNSFSPEGLILSFCCISIIVVVALEEKK